MAECIAIATKAVLAAFFVCGYALIIVLVADISGKGD